MRSETRELEAATPSAIARFWSHVVKSDGCWEWQLRTCKDGYGKFQTELPRVNGKQRQIHLRAHRFAKAIELGRAPAAVVMHTCDNPRCVRPDHLVEGTQAQNIADKCAKGRQATGARHGRHTKPEAWK